MGKLVFVFSGQGDQYPGTGKALSDGFTASADIFTLCDSIRPGTSETGAPRYSQAFNGSYLQNYSWSESTLAELEG